MPYADASPATLTLTVCALYISANDDCSGMVRVRDDGASGRPKDFMQNPVLFSGSPVAGAYKCVAFRMSDVISMRPATSFGACASGVEYLGDSYLPGCDRDGADRRGVVRGDSRGAVVSLIPAGARDMTATVPA